MPKNRSVSKTVTGGIIRHKTPGKFRIGTRRGGKSAILMSSDELKDVINTKDKARYHAKAFAVLRSRGIAINWPGQLAKINNTVSMNDAGGAAASPA